MILNTKKKLSLRFTLCFKNFKFFFLNDFKKKINISIKIFFGYEMFKMKNMYFYYYNVNCDYDFIYV